MARVFLSYSRDSDLHEERVVELVERLRDEGVEVDFDRDTRPTSATGLSEDVRSEDWLSWLRQRIEAADIVLVVCTPLYRRLFEDDDALAEEGFVHDGVGVQGVVLTSAHFRIQGPRFLPVVFSYEDAPGIPSVLQNSAYYVLWEGFPALSRALTADAPSAPSETAPRVGVVRPRTARKEATRSGGARGNTSASANVVPLRPSIEPSPPKARSGGGADKPWRPRRVSKQTGQLAGQLEPGIVLAGRYELVQLVGRGGFGTVWQARDLRLERDVAVKVFQGSHADDHIRVERFHRGARRMASLQHEGVVRVLAEEGEDSGFHFFVMEYLRRGNLRQVVLEGELSGDAALDLIAQVGEALAYAHERGVVHRDVKPSNILLDDDGRPQLTDFDLVRALDTTGGTRTGALGTFVYAAPEQLSNAKNVGPQADIYALGMTAVFALHGADLPATVIRQLDPVLDELDCTPSVRAVLEKALAWERGERWETVREFLQALKAAREPTTGSTSSAPRRPALWSLLTVSLVAAALLALVLFIVAWNRGWFDARPAPSTTAANLDMHFVEIPAGTYNVGSPEAETGRGAADWLPRDVTLRRGFAIAETEVTQAQWAALMPNARVAHFDTCGPSCPVEQVSWFEAVAFANRLSAFEGRQLCYDGCVGDPRGETYFCDTVQRRASCDGYRLPSELEWEIAARAGTQTATYAGDLVLRGRRDVPILDGIAWYSGNSGVDYAGGMDCSEWGEMQAPASSCGTHPVAGKAPNAWGLSDMLGNVREWTGDWYTPSGTDTDPEGSVSGSERIFRGGSWASLPAETRASTRAWSPPGTRLANLGFRLVRSLDLAETADP